MSVAVATSADRTRCAMLEVHREAECLTVVVAVAQLVRAPGCGPGGRGFKSPRSPSFRRRLAGRPARLTGRTRL